MKKIRILGDIFIIGKLGVIVMEFNNDGHKQ